MSTTTTTTTSTSLATTFPKTISAVPPDTNLRGYYQKQGVIHTTNLLSPSKVSTISRAFTSQVELDNTIGHDDNNYRIHSLIETIIIGPVNGAPLMFYFKPPKAPGQALHQDNLFPQARPEMCIAVWIAIGRINGENGGLQVVPGSHKYNLVCPEAEMADAKTSVNCVELRLPRDIVTTLERKTWRKSVLYWVCNVTSKERREERGARI
ncbi:hypothetical protein F5882DRAFT_487957 [Hyaloscypha sp. PMI_1271]|nr:hypothetical protein F5882DRAFT_487957 [Hyaloscypha sp. PMI_1271]